MIDWPSFLSGAGAVLLVEVGFISVVVWVIR